MSQITTTDNNFHKEVDLKDNEDKNNLLKIANTSIKELKENNKNLLVFPYDLKIYGDDLENKHIIDIDCNNKLHTDNIMGFVGVGGTTLKIQSRFDKGDKDYFLHYMLQKVFSINIFDLKHSSNKEEEMYDFMLYLFPYYLTKALQQGIYKEYITKHYNDSNVKGAIEINRFIRQDIPFVGKIAYKTREYSFDNHVTQLIRHTIEYIRNSSFGRNILNQSEDMKDCVSQIIQATPSYSNNDRQKIINLNIRPILHPYFAGYKELQRLCMMILNHRRISYGEDDKNKINGILFDGAWLWEEYLATILKEKGFKHYKRKEKDKNNKFYLFKNNIQRIIPDYLSEDQTIVADAKYIPLDKKNSYSNEERATAIYYKTIMYMCRFNSNKGFLFYPKSTCDDNLITKYTIQKRDTDLADSYLFEIALAIPQYDNISTFTSFCNDIKTNEETFKNSINNSLLNIVILGCYI
jgi:5-methylcytosine-specific restriction enzyme subunit McrC